MHRIATSLGQIYKGRLKETRDLVAVKVQISFVLETDPLVTSLETWVWYSGDFHRSVDVVGW
jgi:hypothetical protein